MAKLTQDEVLSAIAVALELPPETITVDASSASVEEWDSIGHLGVLTQLDKMAEGDAAGLQELATATSVEAILRVLRENDLAA